MKKYDEILAKCLSEIEAGADVNAVVSRYPDHAERLASDLQIFSSLFIGKTANVPPAASSTGRRAMRNALLASQVTTGGDISAIGGNAMRIAIGFAAGAAATLAAVMFGGMLDSSGGSEVHADAYQECILQLDFNDDGVLDVNDVVAFRDAIDSQDPQFDLDGNGTVDIFDAVAAVNGVVECLQNVQSPTPPSP